MIFGRQKKSETTDPEVALDIDLNDEVDEDDLDDETDAEPASEHDEWYELDAAVDRAEGPFDITEVDLDADEVERVDLGALVLTPFPGMQLQLQVNENTQKVQALLVLDGAESGLEVALFGAPKSTLMAPEIRSDMLEQGAEQGGEVTQRPGPFGTELHLVMPVTGPDGEQMYHVSRTWLAQGPRWMLRGVLMGRAATEEGVDGAALTLFEFFSNIVVRRGDAAVAAGDLIALSLPESITQGS